MKPGVSAVIPSIPPRKTYLERALASVRLQSRPVDAVCVAIDVDHDGSAITRNKALKAVQTEYCAFLDDDDCWKTWHIRKLMGAAKASKADVVYPWFDVISPNGFDPFPGVFGRPFDPSDLERRNYIPTTVLSRTSALLDVGGFEPYGDQKESACDDWGLWRKLLRAGAIFHHLPLKTWDWHWHGKHTSGLGTKW